MIEVENLTKSFVGRRGTHVTAVKNITFTARPGEVFGLLGPNGAGKTTTLRMLCTVLKPTSGYARIAGYDVATQPGAVRHHIGFLSANTGIYDRMTAWELVFYYGKLHDLPDGKLHDRIEELFESLQMQSFRDTPGSKMSTGMKQKVSIARAMIHDPPVLVLDEPTAGLDVLVQRSVLQNIASLREQGKCVLFSTHIMREVEKLCDRVALMHKGQILDIGTLDELRERHGEPDLEELFFRLVAE